MLELPALAAALLAFGGRAAIADGQEASANPYFGQPEAVAEGAQLYSRKCSVCHGPHGGRGPDLHETTLSDRRFFETVMDGRQGTQMPAFRGRITPDEVWKIHAYLKSSRR